MGDMFIFWRVMLHSDVYGHDLKQSEQSSYIHDDDLGVAKSSRYVPQVHKLTTNLRKFQTE